MIELSLIQPLTHLPSSEVRVGVETESSNPLTLQFGSPGNQPLSESYLGDFKSILINITKDTLIALVLSLSPV